MLFRSVVRGELVLAERPEGWRPAGPDGVAAPRKSYHGPGATKRASPLFKKTVSKNSVRPSARAMYDMGDTRPVFYDGAKHVMAFRSNGSPYYKKVVCKDDV